MSWNRSLPTVLLVAALVWWPRAEAVDLTLESRRADFAEL